MEAFLQEFQHLKIQLEEVKLATGNFDDNNIIGKGGFGTVYKGVLTHWKGQGIFAFKRLDRKCGQGDSEFLKEILMLSRYSHENLISLVGFCDEDGEKILVYEYASRGSLDHHLSSMTLTWTQRLKICLGAAMGLCYLHDPKETQERVIHRDIKSSNILLDENWDAKVSDMGLSKIGPANQQHTFLVSDVVGTFCYIDPMYMETSILTKESDVYSFGVVLFEVLCGKPCFENNNGHFRSLVRMWKKSYKENKLDEIILHDLKQHMDPRSLDAFSDIAYQCLHEYREERPKMSQIVEKIEIAIGFQEIIGKVEPPMDYEEMSNTVLPSLVYRSEDELKMLLSKGIIVNGGKTWFLLNKNGEHCEMISAAECLIPIHRAYPNYESTAQVKSRFQVDYDHTISFYEFETHVRTQFLSPHITYAVNLVFNFDNPTKDSIGIHYKLGGETNFSTSYIVDKREDGWQTTELYQFTCDTRYVDLEITFVCKVALLVEGIEFQPLKRVEEHQMLEDEEVDMQTDAYWEQKVPTDYEDIIKRSITIFHWRTYKQLFSDLCEGLTMEEGTKWFFISKKGKKCHMLSATRTLQQQEWCWRWRSILESRFTELAFDPRGSFSICLEPKMLSPETTYGTYLVYKLEENHSGFEPPVKVSDDLFNRGPNENDHSWYIYLRTPQVPIIRPKVYQNSHNPLNRLKMKGLPQQRNDDWMEVQIWEFRTGTTIEEIKKNVLLTIPDSRSLKGLLVQGIEFKPI